MATGATSLDSMAQGNAAVQVPFSSPIANTLSPHRFSIGLTSLIFILRYKGKSFHRKWNYICRYMHDTTSMTDTGRSIKEEPLK